MLFISYTISIVILMIRLKVTQSYYLLFLVWNLFLALVPFVLSNYLLYRSNMNKLKLGMITLVWLLFLPNAPYIITDFIHLLNPDTIFWYDMAMIASFAFNGLVLYLLSVWDMKEVLDQKFGELPLRMMWFLLPFVVSFGFYIGRFFRWNSWDIITDPIGLLHDLLALFVNPNAYITEWPIIIGFGIFLSLVSLVLNKVVRPASAV
jgi:uncharacterized membrane protein